jgi:hypothetical protein
MRKLAQAESLPQARRRQPTPQAIAIRQDVALNLAGPSTLRSGCVLRARNPLSNPKWLQDPAVLHATWASRFAGSTVQAMIQMTGDRGVEFEPVFVDRAHQEQAPTRALILVTGLQIGRTDLLAKAAVHAI